MIREQTTPKSFITILLAEDNDVSREMMAGILKTQGFEVVHARDGDEAIASIKGRDVDLALVDINMAPTGGFAFVKHLLVRGIDLPVVIITSDGSSDMLVESSALGVQRVLQKPVPPKTLLDTVIKILKRRGLNPQPMGVETHTSKNEPAALMQRAIELAQKNAAAGKGGPFGAVLASQDGKILGEGVNGIASRSDPTAHAEVMAIRQACERLGRSELSDCVLYVSSEPTMMGKALIISVNIPTVYYGLSHEEVRDMRMREDKVRAEMAAGESAQTQFHQLGHDEAAEMFTKWQSLRSV